MVKSKRFKQIKDQRREIALERIEILKKMIKEKPEFEERYKELIKRIAKKYRLTI
jgi:RNase P subunit RPR2